MYVMAFKGGANKQLRGTCSFFTDSSMLKKVRTGVSFSSSTPSKKQGVINTLNDHKTNPNIFICICGCFTPEQKVIARNKNRFNTEEFSNLYKWIKENNKKFKDEPSTREVVEPIIIEDDRNQNNTDKSTNPGKEKQIDFNFYFPSNGEPDNTSSTFGTTEKFASALYHGNSPTLLFHQNNNYIDDRELDLTKVFPGQFPFGYGGIYDGRDYVKKGIIVKVSPIECIRAYSRIARNSLRRQDFVLVINSMKNTQETNNL